MAKGLVDEQYLTDIADAIRSKNGASTQYKPSEMSAAIENISTKVKPNYVSFYNYPNSSIDLSWLDTDSIRNMSYMFASTDLRNTLDLSNFIHHYITDTSYMFRQSNVLSNINFNGCNTMNVNHMKGMFYQCEKLQSLDLSMFNTHFVQDMNDMFNYCANLAELDISSFDVSMVTNSDGMFRNCGRNLSTPTIVYVKDAAMQQWVLNTNGVPSNWSTANVIIKTNLLNLSEDNAEYVTFEGSGATVTFNNDNTLTVSADGTTGWGVNIAQPNLTLEAGKTYTLSCNNMLDSTWISLNNESDMMIRRSVASKEFTPGSNIVNPTVVIWVASGVVYDNVKWNIKLIENI